MAIPTTPIVPTNKFDTWRISYNQLLAELPNQYFDILTTNPVNVASLAVGFADVISVPNLIAGRFTSGSDHTNTGIGPSTIAGGNNNVNDGTYGFIGNGTNNTTDGGIVSLYPFIGTGNTLSSTGQYTTLLNGNGNTISSEQVHNSILTGNGNTLDGNAHYSMIAAGAGNNLDISPGGFSFLANGWFNSITEGYAFIGTGYYNSVEAEGGIIIGGISPDSGTTKNRVVGQMGFIGTGTGNIVGDVANINHATVGVKSAILAGQNNTVSAAYSAIASGSENSVSGSYSGIFTGQNHTVTSNISAVLCGINNDVTNIRSAVICGLNHVNAAVNSTILAGGMHEISSGNNNAIIAGTNNIVSGDHSVSLYGSANEVSGGFCTLVGGYGAKATTLGQVVLSDAEFYEFSSAADVAGSNPAWNAHQFHARFVNGYQLVTDIDRSASPSAGAATAGVTLAAGGTSWGTISDINKKTNFESVDYLAVINEIRDLDITRWQYKSDVSANRDTYNLGPTAQDFHSSFNFGTDIDKLMINTQQMDGVMFAAIKGLIEMVDAQAQRIATLEKKI